MSETYLGEAPSYVKDWCKRNTYLTIEALENETSVSIYQTSGSNRPYFKSGTFDAKLNSEEWTQINWRDVSISGTSFNIIQYLDPTRTALSSGEKIQFKNINQWNTVIDDFYGVTTQLNAGKSIVYGDMSKSFTSSFNESTQNRKLEDFFFDSGSIVDASNLNMSKIIMGEKCLRNMFYSCNELSVMPITQCFPTHLTPKCYAGMFSYSCIQTATNLPIVELAPSCYSGMFAFCRQLTSAPELPATALADGCYKSMFSGCTSLVNAPKLPATTLASYCYNGMFRNCSSLSAIHFPKAFKDDETILKKAGSDAPWFGATTATIYYDL